MIKNIALGVLGVVLLAVVTVLILAAFKPDNFRVERSTVIQAPPEKVIGLVQDFKEWPKWSPWENLDANLKRDYSGSASGKGAAYAWSGEKTGQGRMEILEASASDRVLIQLDFIKPFEARNSAEFTLTPDSGGTRVTWAMYGQSSFMCKVMGVFMDCESMCGPEFEKGLAAMKTVAEK